MRTSTPEPQCMEETGGSFWIQRNAPSPVISDLSCPVQGKDILGAPHCHLFSPSLTAARQALPGLCAVQIRQLPCIWIWRKMQHLFQVMIMQNRTTQIPGPICHRQNSLSTSSFSKCPPKNYLLSVLPQVQLCKNHIRCIKIHVLNVLLVFPRGSQKGLQPCSG